MVSYLLFVPTLVHLVVDSIQIIWKKKFVDHFTSALITISVGIPCGFGFLLVEGKHYLQPAIAMLCFHFALFSLLLNLVRMVFGSLPRKFSSVTYLNSPSDGEQNWWDKKLSAIPWYGLLLYWFIIFMVGYAVTYQWDCILHGQIACPELYD